MLRAVVLFAGLGALVFAASFTTYIGDGNPLAVTAMVTDSSGNTYVTGSRKSVFLPGYGNSPHPDGFLTKIDAAGKIVFTRSFGAQGSVEPTAAALDPSG